MRNSWENKVIIARNKKALRDFFILDSYEAGIILKGSEVKSIREHKVNLREQKVNLRDSYGRIRDGELLLYNMHISPYSKSRVEDINPKRIRKLLMHRKEIDRIAGKLTDKSLTLVPLSVYAVKNLVKIEIAIAKSKAKRDKRRDIEKREHDREIRRAFKNI